MKWQHKIIFLLMCQASFAQSPLVKQWDFRFGGTVYDYVTCFQQTADGGYILAGYSTSGISGNKTQPCWGNLDYWIVKLDASGTMQWDKRFGGVDQDVLNAVQQTSDGGYILGGYSDSQANGDKTQTSRGFNDYWIVKTDSLGNKIWDKRYGGANDDLLNALNQTADGGYILAGYSGSGISGDKTQANRGYHDYWIVRTDSIGTVLWDKDFGGTDYDFLTNLLITNDGGFLLGGSSSSPAGPDKTQNVWGANDIWLVKTDSLGNKQWDTDYGGVDYDQVNSFCKTSDGGYMLGCYSASNISGNKTQNTWGQGDVWLLKITAAGVIQWDKDFGGTDAEDGIGSVFQDAGGGYIVISNSFSGISGDKTENNLGFAQAWIVSTDSLGNKRWDKTIFTDPEQKVYPMMIQTADGCYAVSEATYGDIAGDKTQANWDNTLSSTDFWIIRYCDTAAITTAGFNSVNTICPGTCIDFTNLSVNATSYQWFFTGANPGFSTDGNPQGVCYPNPGSYDVMLVASGPSGNDTLILSNYITVYPYPAAQGIVQGGDTLFAIQGADTYQWYHNGNIIAGATNYFFVASEGGNYNVVATDANGCEVEAAIFDVAAGMQSPVSSGSLHVFPDPVNDKLEIRCPWLAPADLEISVYSMPGEKIYSAAAKQLPVIDCRQLPPGMYLLEVCSGENLLRVKFIKQ
jgi:hypothetical protein